MREFNQTTKNHCYKNWSIGLNRFDDNGILSDGVFRNPVLTSSSVTDVNAGFVADPFSVEFNNRVYIFFEVWNKERTMGEIGVAEFNGEKCTYLKIALREKFHLSYPNIFRVDNKFYMLPEAWESGKLRLYEALNFPFNWKLKTILMNKDYADPNIIEHEGKWYLFLCSEPLENSAFEIYYSEHIEGPWVPHPKNPILINNKKFSRSAGRILKKNKNIYRFTQDCSQFYGQKVYVSRINKMDPATYKETNYSIKPFMSPDKKSWNKKALHHIDFFNLKDNYFCLIDGY